MKDRGIPTLPRDLCLLHCTLAGLALGPIFLLIQMVLGLLSLGIKWSDREALTILLYLSPSLRVRRIIPPLPPTASLRGE
jgi:hypothetical protein